jgi:mannosyltransferase
MSRRWSLAALVLIIAAGFFLRVYRLDAVPLRGDEAFTVQNWVSKPLVQTNSVPAYFAFTPVLQFASFPNRGSLQSIATIEPHPFLNYVLFRAWGLLVGTSEFAVRYLPALVNLLGIPALYALGCRIGGRRMGLIAALLWALHPYEIWHAQDARNNAIWSGLSAVSLWLGLRALERGRCVDKALYAVVAAVTANIFYLEAFTLLAFALYALVACWRNWRSIVRVWGAVALALLTAGVSFIVLQGHLLMSGSYGGTYGGRGSDAMRLLTEFIPTLTFGDVGSYSGLDSLFALTWPLLVLVLLAGIWWIGRRSRNHALLLLFVGVLPLLLLNVLARRLDIFTPRYVFSVVPAYLLAFAALLNGLWPEPENKKRAKEVAPAFMLLGGFWLLLTIASLGNYFFVHDYVKAKDWPQLTHYLDSNTGKDDLVIQLAADAAFGYYYPKPNIALPANPNQSRAEIAALLGEFTSQHPATWLVGQTFPDWPNAGYVESWMADNMQPVRRTRLAGLNVLEYRSWDVQPDEVVTPSTAVFGDAVRLPGFRLLPTEPTSEKILWVYWQPIQPTAKPLKVFVHLEGGFNPATNGPVWSQDDHYPQKGHVNTDSWRPGTLYRDVYILPVRGLPKGDYALTIGLYDPDTGARLRVGSGDSYMLQTVTLP